MYAPQLLRCPARFRAILTVVALALGVRLAVLPFATSDGGDSAYRVWIAMDWLAKPELLTHGVWGPLHFYLLALTLVLRGDPVVAPVLLGVLLSTASAVLMYLFVEMEFGSRRAALLAALSYSVYSVAIRNGVSVRSETPFAFFLLVGLIAIAHARREEGSWRHAAAGGVALTLAAMLRYEAWLMIPFLAVLLWHKPKLLVIFGACALIHPVFWMVGNWQCYGDPLFSMTAASRFELVTMGREQRDRWALMLSALSYPAVVLRGMGLLVGIISLIGAVLALVRRRPSRVWLLPLAGLLGLLCLSVARGALVPKLNYAESAGMLLFPFSALVYDRLGVAQWRAASFGLVTFGILLSSMVFSCKTCLARVGLGLWGSSPIPRIENQELAFQLLPTIAANLPAARAGLISDNIGLGTTSQVALRTYLPRAQMYLVCVAANRFSNIDPMSTFINQYPRGVLITLSGSPLSQALRIAPGSTSARIGRISMALEPVQSVRWPGSREGELTIFRYTAPHSPTPPPRRSDLRDLAPGCMDLAPRCFRREPMRDRLVLAIRRRWSAWGASQHPAHD